MIVKKAIFVLLIYSWSFFGQECDCFKNITLLQEKIEENQASFQHQVIEKNRLDDYNSFKYKINKKSKSIISKRDCIGLIALYLSFIQDEHSFIQYENDFIPKKSKTIRKKSKSENNKHPIEGIWYFEDGSFSISIFRSKTMFGDWIAVIQKDYSNEWKKGQIKIEFFKNENNTLSCIYWRKNQIPKKYDVNYSDSTLLIGRNLKFYRQKQIVNSNINISDVLCFESLSEHTNYLRIPSFDVAYKAQIDSTIYINLQQIISKNNLIIDVRNNGGGGFEAFTSILPLVLDTHLTESPYYGSVWVSKGNLEYYDTTKYEYAESAQDSINELKYIGFLKEHIGQFTPTEHNIDSVSVIYPLPSTIAIIYNQNTASTAEGFILQSKNSKKVITFGNNSLGAISYGDWVPFSLPELNIWVAITTKKMIFINNDNEELECIGIKPDVVLTPYNENFWFKIILEYLEK